MCRMNEKDKDAAIVAALTALTEKVASLTPKPAERIDGDELQRRILAELRGVGRPAPKMEHLIGCKSELTGATFDVEIQGGKVTCLPNYTLPAGHDKHIADGGLVPDGIELVLKGDNYTYRVWLKDTFWIVDLKTFVGKPPLPSLLRSAQPQTHPADVAAE